MTSSEDWPTVVLLLGYAALNEVRAYRLSRVATVVKQAVGRNTTKVNRVASVLEDATGTPVLRRAEDHDVEPEEPPDDPGGPKSE